MEMIEGTGSSSGSGMNSVEVLANTDSLDTSVVFHVIKDVLGFVLYMHEQIPSVLQDMSFEFDALHSEYNDLKNDLAQTIQEKASSRRMHISRMREVKYGIRRQEKLMNSVSSLQAALQLMITEIPRFQGVILVIGASPVRPQYVYELCFSQRGFISKGEVDFGKSKAAEGLSRKAIRALISNGAGSGSYPGPTKLFLLVKAPSSFNLPLHFLPKRDFKYSKKIVPLRLQLKCRSHYPEVDVPDCPSETSNSINLGDPTSDDFIWFQCRHVVKGLAFKTPTEE